MTDGPVGVAELRALLESTVADPVLVLQEGHVVVAAADDRRGMEVISQAELVDRIGEGSERELEQQAAALSTTIANLGA